MSRRRQRTRFWWVVAGLLVISVVAVLFRDPPPIAVTIDETDQKENVLVARGSIRNDLPEPRRLRIEFSLGHYEDPWLESGYTFFGRSIESFDVPERGSIRFEVSVPILKKTKARVQITTVILEMGEIQKNEPRETETEPNQALQTTPVTRSEG